jgi:hypothetical protein
MEQSFNIFWQLYNILCLQEFLFNDIFFRLHGHHKLKEFILSQHPTDEVREDFWRMLWDHNAQTVVLLSSIDAEVQIYSRGGQSLFCSWAKFRQ